MDATKGPPLQGAGGLCVRIAARRRACYRERSLINWQRPRERYVLAAAGRDAESTPSLRLTHADTPAMVNACGNSAATQRGLS